MESRIVKFLLTQFILFFSLPLMAKTYYMFNGNAYDSLAEAESAATAYVQSNDLGKFIRPDPERQYENSLNYFGIQNADEFSPHVSYPCTGGVCDNLGDAIADYKSQVAATSTCKSSITQVELKGDWSYDGWGRISGSVFPQGTILKKYSREVCHTLYWHQLYYNKMEQKDVCIKKGPAGGCGGHFQEYHAWTCPAGTLRSVNPTTENGIPECIKSTLNISIKHCYAPYDIDEATGLCVAYCPKSSPNLDPDLGVCLQPGEKVEPDQCATMAGNPIETRNGEKIHLEMPDYVGGGSFPLTFARNYKSGRLPKSRHNFAALESSGNWVRFEQPTHYQGLPSVPSSLNIPNPDAAQPSGNVQWRHNYTKHLYVSGNEAKLLLTKANGGRESFSKGSSGDVYTSKNRSSNRVIKQAGGNWLYIDGSGFKETYDSEGRLTKVTNVEGLSHTLTYNALGLLSSIKDDANREITLVWDEYQRISSMISPNGEVTQYQYSGGNLTKVIHPDNTPSDDSDNASTVYQYGNSLYPNALTGLIDKNGFNWAKWTYDGNGKAIASENFDGLKKTQIVYGDNTVTVTEANNHVRTLTFDNQSRLLSVAGGNCGQCGGSDVATYDYDSYNQLTSETDFNGIETRYQYNSRGLVTRRTEAYGLAEERITDLVWHPELALPTQIKTPVITRDFVYDANGKVLEVSETDRLVSTTPVRKISYSYDASGRLSSIDGPRTDVSDITSFTYHSNGDLASISNALGHSNQYTQYDANGRPLTMVDANGITTSMTYDAMGQVISTTTAGYTTSYEYDAMGQLLKITEPGNITTHYAYNGARQLTSITDGSGNQIAYSYDNMNNVTNIEVKDDSGALFASQSRQYDNLNRLSNLVDGLNHTISYSYDNVGNLISTTTPLLKETKQVFDALNRLIESETADQKKTQYTYTAADQLSSVKAANNALTQYQMNGFSEVYSQTSPDTGVTTFSYDSAGNVITKKDAREVEISYEYDALNRVTKIDFSTEQTDILLAYDSATHGIGQLAQVTDFSGSTAYSYNSKSELSQKTSTVGTVAKQIGYQYDATGQLSGITYPSGRQVSMTRNGDGLISKLEVVHNAQTQILINNVSYYPFGNVRSYNMGNGVNSTKTYNANGQIISSTDTGILERTISYSADAQIAAITDALLPEKNQTFTYDDQDRLSTATGDYGQIDYSYDSVGNRLSKTDDGVTQNWEYLANSNQLAGNFAHDANGNRTLDSKRSYQYNAENRLASMTETESGITTEYIYNAMGQRVKKHNMFGTTLYFYDEDGLLLAETDGDGKVIKEYVYFNQQPIAMLAGE